jgi:hypothetical protein
MKLGLMLGVTVKYLFSMDTQEFLWDSTVAPAAQLSSEVALETRVCTTNLSTSAI